MKALFALLMLIPHVASAAPAPKMPPLPGFLIIEPASPPPPQTPASKQVSA
ncbi:hypothetical protein [Jannaschia sp. 2305UL9-9]|uniref:hypothetical protein n=1 Tax=Jannaschia sp. 2305UL9-9 TaxID=3121638 RepID=UPI0035281579